VDDAIWRDVSVLQADQAAPTRSESILRPRPASVLVAAAAFAFVAFLGGGLFTGALALYALSLHPARLATVPRPVRQALSTITDAATSGRTGPGAASEPRLAILFAALPDWEGTEPFNILLLGIDQRDDERAAGSDPGRTDTMMLLRIDPRARSAGLVSFPRDLWVQIPGVGQGRINSAYTYGEIRKPGSGGPDLAKRTIEQNFGLHVDYYALVNFHGLEQIVDTVGGIVIDVERPIKDNEYPTEDYGIERVYIPPGPQLMDGRLALRYARSRHSDNDFGRMHRQQQVLFALRQRALQTNALLRAPSLVGLARQMISTDLDLGQLVRLAKLAQQVDADHIHSMVIDASLVREANPAAGHYELLWDKERIRRALAGLIAGMSPQQAARIEVLNGSGRPGLAADTAKLLLNLGYQVTRIDDADRDDYAESVLEVAPDRRSLADDLATTLRLARWSARAPHDADGVDVRLIVGRDFRLPQSVLTPTLDATPGQPSGPAGLRAE